MRAGYLAEFTTEEAFLQAIEQTRDEGYTVLDAFTPYRVAGLEQRLGLKRSWINWLVFPIALSGAAIGYLIQWYVLAVDFPLNVGGRPAHAYPTFIPITFETMVLFSGISGFILYFLLCRLPRWWQPLFEVRGFDSVSVDHFWLAVERTDPLFEREATRRFLQSLGAERVSPVGMEGES